MTEATAEKEIQVALAKPPCWKEANAFFKLEELGLGTIFTYGDTIYNPFKVEITPDLEVHERVHAGQQGWTDEGAKVWWEKFIADKDFRVQQEVEAYGTQYRFLCRKQKDRNKRARMLWTLASQLSGPMYGSVVTHSDAMRKIREYAKV